jgi:hypothetical protein
MYNHRGEPTGTNHQSTPQAEQFRRQPHPYQGASATADTVGTYQGMDRDTNMHFFSADAKGGGITDSIMIPHHEQSRFVGNKGQRYTFGIDRSSADVRPYDPKTHYGIPGAPLSDTPADMADHKFKGNN